MRRILALAVLLPFAGCANLSTHQTARAIPEGTARGIAGFGFFSSPTINEQISKATTLNTTIQFPFVEFGARFGVMKNLEAGGKLTLPGFLSGDVKYQFLDAGAFAAAGGLGLSYLGIAASPSSSTSSTTFSTSFLDLVVPGYASYDFTYWLGLYVSPKFVLRMAMGGTSGTATLAGSTLGVRLGNRGGIFLEGSLLKGLSSRFTQGQFNFGIFFGSAPSVPEKESENAPEKSKAG